MRTHLLLCTLLAASAAAGCGKVTALVDGAPGIDGKTADANNSPDANPRGTVKVTTYDPTGARVATAGVQVVFKDPDGTLVARMPSDVNGKAQADLLPGGSVTAVWSLSATYYRMETILGVKPGDDLALIGMGQDNRAAGSFGVSWPAYTGAASYSVWTNCGGAGSSTGTTSYNATFTASCAPTGAMTVAVAAQDSTGQPLAYLEQGNITFTDGGSVSLTGTWGTFSSFQATLTNLDPTMETNLNINRSAGNDGFWNASAGNQVTAATLSLPPSGSTMSVPTTAGTALVHLSLNGKTFTQQQQIYQGIAGNSFAYNLDVGSKLLPWVSIPQLDVTTGTITVPMTGTGAVDAALVDVQYTRPSTSTRFDWIVLGPGISGPITLPTLPIEAGDVNPKTGDTVASFGPMSAIMEADQVTSYDQIRNDLLTAAFGTISNYAWYGPVPTGFVRLSIAQNAG